MERGEKEQKVAVRGEVVTETDDNVNTGEDESNDRRSDSMPSFGG